MPISTISSASLWNVPRANIARMESELTRLNTELVTGRMADAGLELGAGTARATTVHIDLKAFASTIESNAVAAARIESSEAALADIDRGIEAFKKDLITTRNLGTPIAGIAETRLEDFIRMANASDGRNYLFAGINSDVAPLGPYEDAAKAMVDAAFLAKFGFDQSDARVSQIGASDMADFLANEFAALFDDPDWAGGWSTASDRAIRAHISPKEVVDTSVSINEPATRKLAMVYTMTAALGVDRLSDDARNVLLDRAIVVAGEATTGLTDLRSGLGLAANRVEEATERLTIQTTVLGQRIANLEGVDPAETKVKIDALMTQIEMSYALTARIMRLSILSYV